MTSLTSASFPTQVVLNGPKTLHRFPGLKTQPIASAVPNARVEMFENAGHALFVDDAERFNKVLADFIQHIQTN